MSKGHEPIRASSREIEWCTRLNDFRTILIDPPEEVSELLEEIQSSFTHLLTALSPQASRTIR